VRGTVHRNPTGWCTCRRLLAAVFLVGVAAAAPAQAYTLTGPTNYNVPPLTAIHGLQSVDDADFNADGRPDLVVAHEDPYKLAVLLGGVGGTFGAPTDLPLGSHSNPLSVRSADFNGDGDPDLATANEGSSDGTTPGWVSVLLGGAGSSFSAPVSYSAGVKPQDIAIADFNGDNDPDIAIANETTGSATGTVSILLGGAGGTFSGPTNYQAATAVGTIEASPRAVAAADFNGDADPDLAIANQGNDQVSVLLGGAGGSFGAPTNYAACGTPNSLTLGDFNGDADTDLAVVNETCNNISIRLGGAGATFGARTDFSVGILPDEIAAGDLNGDAKLDLAVSNQTSDNLSVLLGLGTGGFASTLNFTGGDGPTGVDIGQFNGDSRLDIAMVNEISNNVSIYLGSPDGYARPLAATPLTFRLVPAFTVCASSNSTHGSPLSSPSCSPPVQTSSFLTFNGPDRPAPYNGTAGATGIVQMKVFCTNGSSPPCPAAGDQEDVQVSSTITDVRCTGTSGGCSSPGSTYSGMLLFTTTVRMTDRLNGPFLEPGTVTDFPLPVGMQCSSGTCNITTSADAVMPGLVPEGKRSVWQLTDIQILDGGANGTLAAAPAPASGTCPPACAGDDGEGLFMRQGFFTP
jgi:hypothetical protein